MKVHSKAIEITKDRGNGPKRKFMFLRAFLEARSSDETRAILTYLFIDKDRMVATDGRRLHSAENIYNLGEGLWTVLANSGRLILLVPGEERCSYPNYKQVIPNMNTYSKAGEYSVKELDSALHYASRGGVCVSYGYMRTALDAGGFCKLYCADDKPELAPLVVEGDRFGFQAIIMPIRTTDRSGKQL